MNKVKKYMIAIIYTLLFMFLISCNFIKEDQVIEKTMDIGEVFQIDVGDEYEFTSSDLEIVEVNDVGIMKALKEGQATIVASSNKDMYTINVTVNKKSDLSMIIVNCKQTIDIDEKVKINPVVIESNNQYVYTYVSNDSNVAIVSSDGVITGVGSGVCTITIIATAIDVLAKELTIYVKNEDTTGSIINNVIENRTYEINGDFDLTYLNSLVTNIVSNNKESIVGVSNYQYVLAYPQKQLVEAGVGTGFIFDSKKENNSNTYYVLTNYHVIEENAKLKIYFGYESEYIDATLVGSNSNLDLAVLSFVSDKTYKIIPLGDVSNVSEGDFAVAIGNANGYDYFGSVTFGVVSYVNRHLEGEEVLFLQHDVAINPGNSGGPLFDINGNVIGINTLKIVQDEVENIGFAISINSVKDYLKTLGWK